MAISESEKGRIIEQLVGTTLILQSGGALRARLPIVDDEGVDLVVGRGVGRRVLARSRIGVLPIARQRKGDASRVRLRPQLYSQTDMWTPFRLSLKSVAAAILQALK